MVYKFQCSLDEQDCATLYPGTQGRNSYKLPFTSQSCVRDNRLEGNVGRCGFSGAPCVVDSRGQDNCAGGYYFSSRPVCQNGACRGEPGASCRGDVDCNWGINCNVTLEDNGVCGGYGAYMNDMESHDGLDFGRDYCLSGKAYQNSVGYWLCAGGPPMALTSPPLRSTTSPKHKVSKALIAGVSAAAAGILIAIIAFIIWWRRRHNRSRQSPVPATASNERSSSIDQGKIRDIYVPPSQSTPSPRPYTIGESSAPTDNSSFSNPMIAPSGPSFPPEIQSEQYSGRGNIPMRHTTTLASLEKRTVMARQGPDAASNSNSGFYTSAISPTINAMPSSNQLYDATKAPLNHGIPATMNMQSPSNWFYEPAKVPLKQGSEKDG